MKHNGLQKGDVEMRRSLYPNTLFHFTKRDGLFGILAGNFLPRFSSEKVVGPTLEKEFAVPMVSFCDLRLSELPDHICKYGPYGLGMSKEWANTNGLNPVNYLSSGCSATDRYLRGISALFDMVNGQEAEREFMQALEGYNASLESLRYMKNYERARGGRIKSIDSPTKESGGT